MTGGPAGAVHLRLAGRRDHPAACRRRLPKMIEPAPAAREPAAVAKLETVHGGPGEPAMPRRPRCRHPTPAGNPHRLRPASGARESRAGQTAAANAHAASPRRQPPDPALACSRDEQRLGAPALRPGTRDAIASLQRELSCARLGSPGTAPVRKRRDVEPRPPRRSRCACSQGGAGAASAERSRSRRRTPCARDSRRGWLGCAPIRALMRSPDSSGNSAASIIRPQLRRLRESLGL